MSNPLFNSFAGRPDNMAGMVRQFQEFKKTFQGNPQQQVQQLLNTGRVTQAQYDQAVQMAKSLSSLLNG